MNPVLALEKARAKLNLKKRITELQREVYARKGDIIRFAVDKHITSKDTKLEFQNHRFLLPLYTDKSETIVVKKPAQVGVTEFIIVRIFEAASRGLSSFMVLPKQSLRNTYVKTRIDPLLDGGCYSDMIRNPGEGNLLLKTLNNNANLIFVGSNSRSEMVSHPADQLVIDELDYCTLNYLSLAEKRLDHSREKRRIYVSTPTIANYGIDRMYKNSDMKVWKLKCEYCGTWQSLNFFGNVLRKDEDITGEWLPVNGGIAVCCIKCGKEINRYAMGEYVATQESDISGYQLPALCHPTKTIEELYSRYCLSGNSAYERQSFENNDLGECYTAEGTNITNNLLDKCKKSYTLANITIDFDDTCTIGIDVGKYLHIIISRHKGNDRQVIYIGKLLADDDRSVGEIDRLVIRYRVRQGVIDLRPETVLSKKICEKTDYIIWGCDYSTDGQPSEIIKKQPDHKRVIANRTWVIDEMVEDFKRGLISLPADAHDVMGGEYYRHMQAPVRLMIKANNGRVRYSWDEGGADDHFFHASVYDKIARMMMDEYYFGDRKSFQRDAGDRVFNVSDGKNNIFSL